MPAVYSLNCLVDMYLELRVDLSVRARANGREVDARIPARHTGAAGRRAIGQSA